MGVLEKFMQLSELASRISSQMVLSRVLREHGWDWDWQRTSTRLLLSLRFTGKNTSLQSTTFFSTKLSDENSSLKNPKNARARKKVGVKL